mmetsp:Transcript_10419/g.9200  ORF Transcript_10419/g.9200 Transcript_10419/m.9200 type:complete len:201 (+) Transcript_10419:476-1078(+)
MHKNDVIYRNLKASNILINSDGYIKLGDFDFSKRKVEGHANSILNLSEYQAPEVISNEGYDQTIDWWALGIVIGQMLFPEVKFTQTGVIFPESTVSKEAEDLVSKLLERQKNKRLGAHKDQDEILSHPFFKGIDFEAILNKTATPPYKPFLNPNDPYYVSNFNNELIKQPPRESVISNTEKERISKEILDFENSLIEDYA